MARVTHSEKVLALLSDHQPHSHLEGYRLGVMLHSRVADLRKKGYVIKCWHENGLYLYQLFGTVPERERMGETAAAPVQGQPLTGCLPAGSGSTSGEPASSSLPFEGPAQPMLWEAA